MSEQKVSVTLCGGFLCEAGAIGGCHSPRIIVRGTECKIKHVRADVLLFAPASFLEIKEFVSIWIKCM